MKKAIKVGITLLALTIILAGLISLFTGIQWQPIFVIKQKEIVKERVIEPKIIEVEKETIKRIGESYNELDREILSFCLESGRLNCSIKSSTDWNYWQTKKKQIDELENKLLEDKLVKKR